MKPSTVPNGLRRLRDLLAAQNHQQSSDEQLLHAFLTDREDSAFAVLVRRHGPMVLRVCRRVLGHQQDAEDAFQATFLIFSRKAASLRMKSSLASWLHGVAYRTALKAKQTAVRRRKHEGQAPTRSPDDPAGELLWREVRTLLDEEIARLEEPYRSVFILCCLENVSQVEVSRRLGLKARTVSNRLAEARARLQRRLSRRGVELTALLAATTLTADTVLALPPASGALAATVAELAADSLPFWCFGKSKLALAILLAAILLGGGIGAYRKASPSIDPSPVILEPPAPANDKEDKDRVEVRGVVVDPDGKPFAGAKVYFLARFRAMQMEPEGDFARVRAVADGEGRFRFRVLRRQLQPDADEETRFVRNSHPQAVVTAVGGGHGFAWTRVNKIDEVGKLTLHLVKDDAPIHGRVVDLEGKPISGVRIRVMLVKPPLTDDLQPWLDEVRKNKDSNPLWKHHAADIQPQTAGMEKAIATDADGRFRLHGIGRERIATLRLDGPTVETHFVYVMTRSRATFKLPQTYLVSKPDYDVYHGAVFEYAAAPTVPIVGTVRDKDTKKPLAGIVLESRIPSADGGPHVSGGPARDYLRAVTDKEGNYRLIGLPKRDDLTIRALSPPDQAYFRFGKSVRAGLGLEPVRVDFELKRGVRIHGRVTDKGTGKPLKADIHYFIFSDNPAYVEDAGDFREGNSITTRSDADGAYSLVGLPRRGIVTAKCWPAKAERYLIAVGADRIKGTIRNNVFPTYPFSCDAIRFHILCEVNPGKDADSVTCDLSVDPGKTVEGVVEGPDGKPLTGVYVQGPRTHLPRGDQLDTAHFTLTGINPKNPRWFFFFHKKKLLGAAVRLTGEEPKDYRIRLQPCATITGRVVDVDGKPKAGVQVNGYLENEKDSPWEGLGGLGVKTDKEGRFRAVLLPGLKWQRIAIQENNIVMGQLLRDVTFRVGEIKDLGELMVKELQ